MGFWKQTLNKISSGTYSRLALNNNFEKIEELTSSRLCRYPDNYSGDVNGNGMHVDLDMNGNKIINYSAEPVNPDDIVNKRYVDNTAQNFKTYSDEQDFLLRNSITELRTYSDNKDEDIIELINTIKIENNIHDVFVDSIDELPSEGIDKIVVFVKSYHKELNKGGAFFYYDEDMPKENHNGGTIIDPTAIFPNTWGITAEQLAWYNSSNSGNGCWVMVNDNNSAMNVYKFGAIGDGIVNDTLALQRTIDYVAEKGGKVFIPKGLYMVWQLIMKSGVYIEGEGHDIVKIKQIAGANRNLVESYEYGTNDIHNCGLVKLELDGNYISTSWKDENAEYNNTSGNGLVLQAHSILIDINIGNIAEVGVFFDGVNNREDGTVVDNITDVSIFGRVFGKEGIIIRETNDWLLRKAFIGLAGMLKRPESETEISMSNVYQGEPVSGIVLDKANIEIGELHVYANWSGTGFTTKRNCRLTKGGRIISESNRGQIKISEETYGSAFFDVRNTGLLHPDWTGSIPVYTAPNSVFDAVYIEANDFICDVTVKRTITGPNRVVGHNGVSVMGSATVNVTYSNSHGPLGDPEAGELFSGTPVAVYGDNATVSLNARSVNGDAIQLFGECCNIDISVRDVVNGAAIRRSSLSNSKIGNNIKGSIKNCEVGFNSVGTPMSEVVNLSMKLFNSQQPFIGDKLDINRGQIWNISASVNNIPHSTISYHSEPLDATDTDYKTFTFPHKMLYKPYPHQVQISISDASTPTDSRLEVIAVKEITDTDITIVYKYDVADTTLAANQFANIRIG